MIPILTNLSGKKIILASNSPRRQELLKGLDVEFEVKTHPIDEKIPEDLPASFVAAYLSKLKADAFPDTLQENEILITSDTVVIHRGHILGKPQSSQEAFEMLKMLSGSMHQVITAVTIRDCQRQVTLEDESLVTFRHLDEAEIWHYVREFKPFDKAGAYGIQEWMGYIGITRIEGSYYTVMGFPLHLVYEQLKKWPSQRAN